MKRLMIALFTVAMLASCSSDDDNNTPQNGLIGSWTLIEANTLFPIDVNNDGTADPDIMKEIPCFEGSISFMENDDFSRSFSILKVEEINGVQTVTCDGNERLTGTYEIVGDRITFTIDGPEPTTDTYPYELEGNILKVTMPVGNFGNVELVSQRD